MDNTLQFPKNQSTPPWPCPIIFIYIYIKRLGHACSCIPEVLACPSGVQCLTHQTQTWQPKWSFCASMIKLFTSVNGFVVLGGVVWILLKKKQNGGERKVCKFMFVCESDSWKWIFPCAIRIFCSVINLYHYTWFSWENFCNNLYVFMYACRYDWNFLLLLYVNYLLCFNGVQMIDLCDILITSNSMLCLIVENLRWLVIACCIW